jgi:hypothetical protein
VRDDRTTVPGAVTAAAPSKDEKKQTKKKNKKKNASTKLVRPQVWCDAMCVM